MTEDWALTCLQPCCGLTVLVLRLVPVLGRTLAVLLWGPLGLVLPV